MQEIIAEFLYEKFGYEEDTLVVELLDLLEPIVAESLEREYGAGYNDGELDGKAEGYDAGYAIGYSDKEANSNEEGYNEGYDDGYAVGKGLAFEEE